MTRPICFYVPAHIIDHIARNARQLGIDPEPAQRTAIASQALRQERKAVATAAGIVNALDLPARLAFVIDMVGRDDLPNAIALNSLLFNTARAVGPALSAVVFAHVGSAATGQGPQAICKFCTAVSSS